MLLFVLGRNLVRMLMEWRRGVFGARLRMQLLLVFLLMAVAPSLLLLLVGSDLIRQTVDRWFNVDVERLLASSQALGAAARRLGRARRAASHARAAGARDRAARAARRRGARARLRRTIEARARERELDLVSVYGPAGELVSVMDPRLPSPATWDAASGEALADAALHGTRGRGVGRLRRRDAWRGSRCRCAAPDGRPAGAVVVSTFLAPEVASAAREVQDRYTKFRKTQTYREPILAFYRSLYLFPALLILFGAVWLALYLARRITTPLRLVGEGAERIAAGERGMRVDFPSGSDEFRALIASFNRMSERLARSEEEVEFSRAGLVRKNQELEERRRLTETVLETVGTGVVVVDQEGTLTAANAAAQRLLELEPGSASACRSSRCCAAPGARRSARSCSGCCPGRVTRQEREVLVPSRERDRHLAVTVVSLPGALGAAPGALVVVDDLTPLMRAQKVAAWGEVARKLAHEIKNPLTPIQLSAQRVRKAWLKSDPGFERSSPSARARSSTRSRRSRTWSTSSRSSRGCPPPTCSPAALDDVIEQALSLYDGLFPGITVERQLAPDLPPLRLDPDQMKRVLINLVDNAIEATDGKGCIVVATEYDRGAGTRAAGGGRRRARASRRPTATGCSCRTSRRRSAAAASAWRSSAASCRSTTARSGPRTTGRAARASWWSCRREGAAMRETILVVDDESGVRSSLTGILADEGYQVEAVASGEAALAALETRRYDLVLLDVWLPGADGLEVLGRIREQDAELPVVVISGHGTIETAVKAVRLGAQDFVEKPLSLEKTLLAVQQRAAAAGGSRREVKDLRRRLDERYVMIGESPAHAPAARRDRAGGAHQRARADLRRERHRQGAGGARDPRRRACAPTGPFVEVNCAAIPEELIESELFGHVKGAFTGALAARKGKFELADGGTLFLDEIGDMSLKTQAKVLRALQEQRIEPVGGAGTVDGRRARDRRHQQEPRGGDPRRPLPRGPLLPAERDPVPRAAAARAARGHRRCSRAHFMDVLSAEHGRRPREIAPEALHLLSQLPWPGNVRELRNIIERLVIMAPGRAHRAAAPAGVAARVGRAQARRARRAAGRRGRGHAGRGARGVRAPLHPAPVPRVRRQHEPHRRGARRRALEPLPEDEGLRPAARAARRRRGCGRSLNRARAIPDNAVASEGIRHG